MLYRLAVIALLSLYACQNKQDSPKTHTDAPKKITEVPQKGWKDGDIIFQISLSGQGKAIELATHSHYTHCGVMFQQKGAWFVLEAIQPVSVTPLSEWIARGDKGHFAVKRLRDAEKVLTPAILKNMLALGKSWLGKNYDIYFGWSDERMYCSELVWKMYDRGAQIQLSPTRKLGSFDLNSPEVRQKLQERYGNQIPHNEKVISPAQLFESPRLVSVSE